MEILREGYDYIEIGDEDIKKVKKLLSGSHMDTITKHGCVDIDIYKRQAKVAIRNAPQQDNFILMPCYTFNIGNEFEIHFISNKILEWETTESGGRVKPSDIIPKVLAEINLPLSTIFAIVSRLYIVGKTDGKEEAIEEIKENFSTMFDLD